MNIYFINIAFIFLLSFGIPAFSQSSKNTDDELKSFKDNAALLHTEVDSILANARIKPEAIKKKVFETKDQEIKRTERRINVSEDFSILELNRQLNLMAQKYGGRAIGSENTKEKSVAIHIKLDRYIIETIILRTTKDLKPAIVEKQKQKKK
ncbi:MAG: hypothetical protein C0417_03760 [Chlorobiaceae bacterium]|nr:hypothetical protein [Chlorobiaceae bacterium]